MTEKRISLFDVRLRHTIGMQPAIPYIRYSDPKQERGSSRQRQRDLIAEECARHGWQMGEPVEDLGRSAWHGDHLRSGQLGALTRRILNGEIAAGTIIVAEKIDRLSRQGYDALNEWMKSVTRAGARVFTVDDGKLYDATNVTRGMESQMLRLMKAEAARDYVENMRGRVVEGIRSRQRRETETNKPSTAVIPGWLRRNSLGEIEISELRAEIIRDIYRWSAEGMGSQTIATRLNRAGRLTWSAKPWQPSTIYKLLDSCTVEGDVQPTADGKPLGPKRIGFYPRIVEADLVKQAREAKLRRRSQKGAGPSSNFVNIFQGLAKCGECHGRLHVQKCQDNRGTVRRYFRCDRAARHAGCERKAMFHYGRVEGPILDTMLHLALDDRFFSRPDNIRPLANEVANLEKLAADLKDRSRRLIRIMTNVEDLDPQMVEEQASLRERIKTTEAGLEIARTELHDARGGTSPDLHMKRVLEIRDAITSDELDTAMAARRAIRDSMRGVVEVILSHVAPDGEPMIMVALVGGLIGFRVSAKTGAVSDHYDLTPQLIDNPRLRVGATSHRGDGVERLDALLRRRAQ